MEYITIEVPEKFTMDAKGMPLLATLCNLPARSFRGHSATLSLLEWNPSRAQLLGKVTGQTASNTLLRYGKMTGARLG
jgi:hypothetical protein